MITTISVESSIYEPLVAVLTKTAFEGYIHTDINDTFFNTSEFGTDKINWYSNFAGKFVPLTGIFDNEYSDSDPRSEQEIANNEPQLWTRDSFLYPVKEFNPNDKANSDYMIIKGKKYYIRNVEPDGTGVTVVYLYNG